MQRCAFAGSDSVVRRMNEISDRLASETNYVQPHALACGDLYSFRTEIAIFSLVDLIGMRYPISNSGRANFISFGAYRSKDENQFSPNVSSNDLPLFADVRS